MSYFERWNKQVSFNPSRDCHVGSHVTEFLKQFLICAQTLLVSQSLLFSD